MKYLSTLNLVKVLCSLLFCLFTVTACAESSAQSEDIGTVSVLHQWVSGGEPESFNAVVDPWEEQTGGTVQATGTRDIKAILVTRIEGNNPPDIGVLSAPGDMRTFAQQGHLVPLDSFLDMDKIESQYADTWLDLCRVDGKLYCLVYKVSNKAVVWYDPREFNQHDWQVPETWQQMIDLSNRIVDQGGHPWSVGLESGGASGWPGSDWIGQILLAESGPEIYDRWVKHEIPWTHEAVKSAFEKFGHIVYTSGYVPGGAIFALSTNFVDAAYLPFRDPPQAYLYYLGSFAQSFIEGEFPKAEIARDYDFFPFPTLTPAYKNSVTGGADFVVLLRDMPGGRSLMQYLASAEAQEIWVRRGGFTSVNQEVALTAYPDQITKGVARQLIQASHFRFDADDTWGGALQQAFWRGILDYVQTPDQLSAILNRIEQVAVEQYGSVGNQ